MPFVMQGEEGHLSVVQELLEDDRVDPAADNSYAICLARRNGHLSVVQALGNDDRIDT